MATDEGVRYRLHRKLDDLVGPDEAALLMTSVPPFPWTEVVTKADLDLVSREIRGELRAVRGELLEKIGALDGKIGTLDGRVRAQTWKMFSASFVSSFSTAGLVFATLQLT